MSTAGLSIIDEVESAIRLGSAEKGLETARRVTDLFLSSAGSFDDEQIALFDDVLERLIGTIELRALADMGARIALAEISAQLAPIAQAPPSVIRRLAGNDEIRIAGPVLQESARLDDGDLVKIAASKGEPHLLAIAGRWWLKEIVTDALLARRYPSVSRRLAANPGARVSGNGFAAMVGQAEADPELAVSVGVRVDLPSELRRRLLRSASDAVRARLLSRAPPHLFEEIGARSRPSPSVSIARCRVSAISKGQNARLQCSRRPASSAKRRCSVSPRSGAMKRPPRRWPRCPDRPSR